MRVASVDDHASLRALLDGADVLINCAGPFTFAGEPVVRAAVDAGVHYVDSTGEQPFIRMVFDRYGAAAEREGPRADPRAAGSTTCPATASRGSPRAGTSRSTSWCWPTPCRASG